MNNLVQWFIGQTPEIAGAVSIDTPILREAIPTDAVSNLEPLAKRELETSLRGAIC